MANGYHIRSLKSVFDYYLTNASVTPKLAPMATSYTPNFATDEYYSDISADLASGASLITLSNFAVNLDAGNTRIEFDADDISEASQTFTTDKFSIVFDTGSPSTTPVFCTIDFTEGTLNPVAGTFAITVNAEGFGSIAAN